MFDLAGTTVDHGCFAPVAPFAEALRRHGVHVTVDEVRAPMGLAKIDHLRALLAAPAAAAQWRERYGAAVTDADVERVYVEDFVPLQLASVSDCSTLITGALDCAAALRERAIKIATTTGYFAAAAELCWRAAREQGFETDCNVHPEQVTAGRPAPWMIFHVMETARRLPAALRRKGGRHGPRHRRGAERRRRGPSASRRPAATSGCARMSWPPFRRASGRRALPPCARSCWRPGPTTSSTR